MHGGAPGPYARPRCSHLASCNNETGIPTGRCRLGPAFIFILVVSTVHAGHPVCDSNKVVEASRWTAIVAVCHLIEPSVCNAVPAVADLPAPVTFVALHPLAP
jgi:hypothetical protein